MTNGKDSAFAKSAFYHPDGGIDIPQEGLTTITQKSTPICQCLMPFLLNQ